MGGNFSGFSDWFATENQNSAVSSFAFDAYGAARYNDDKQFLYNEAILAVGRLSTDNDTDVEDDEITSTVPNKLNISSLYGYKLIKDIAISANATYNTAVIGNAFEIDPDTGAFVLDADGNRIVSENGIINNPGDLDLGIGATWTPSYIPNFYLMVHPLNYHWKFGDNPSFDSGLGAKVKAGYAREIIPGVSWISTLEGFLAYSDAGLLPDGNARPSADWYEWTNTFAFSVWKGIGVGATYGIRRANSEIDATQTRYSVGLSYVL